MADRPAPVTDLAWSPEEARELGAGVLDLWTELLERLPDELVTRERAPLDTAAALALPVPEEPMPTEDVLAYLRELTFEQSLHMGHPAYFAGLKCARDQRLGVEVRERGVAGAGPVAIYASEEAHVVIRRGADMLGLGADVVR